MGMMVSRLWPRWRRAPCACEVDLVSKCQVELLTQVEAPKCFCGTLVVDNGKRKRKSTPGDALSDRLASSIYQLCRNKTFELSGFPDFAPLLAQLTATNGEAAAQQDAYQVTHLVPSGNLVIQERFFQQFAAEDFDRTEFDELVTDHNARFNKDNVRLSEPAASPPSQAQDHRLEVVQPGDGTCATAESLAKLPNLFYPQCRKWSVNLNNITCTYMATTLPFLG